MIQSWFQEFVIQIKQKICELNVYLIQLNDDESRLQIDEQNLLVIQTNLNEEKYKLISTGETLENKLYELEQKQKENYSRMEILKSEEEESWFGLGKFFSSKVKVEKWKLSNEFKSLDEIKRKIVNLLNEVKYNEENISQVNSNLNSTKLKINSTKEEMHLKSENHKLSENLINNLSDVLSEFSKIKTIISSNIGYKRMDKSLRKELSGVICQVLKAQKDFFKIINCYEKVQDAFENVLNDAISIYLSNEDGEDKAVEKLENSERNLTLIQSRLQEIVNKTNQEIDVLNDQLVQQNGHEARLTADEKKLLEIQTFLNSEKHGLVNQKEALERQLYLNLKKKEEAEKRIIEIEQNKEDAKMEKDHIILGRVYNAINRRSWRKLFFSSYTENLFSTITFEKKFCVADCNRVQREIEFLDKHFDDIQNRLEKNSYNISEIQNITSDVKKRINEIGENITKKGKIVTARSNIILDLKIMHDKFNRLKQDLTMMNEYDEKEALEMKEFVKHIFKAQRIILEQND